MRKEIFDAPNVNTLWATVIVDELARCGVRHVIISPGSRSTPLTVAASRHPDLICHTILDERSAAFFALGFGKERRIPAALICTSGTAAANYYPAVCEAHAAHVPVILLTADRPEFLQDTGAPQTMSQRHLYSNHVTWDTTLPHPDAREELLRALRSTICQAVETATVREAGPVHLNVPFRKPLEPVAVPEGHHAYIPETAKAAFAEGAFGRTHGGSWFRISQNESSVTGDSEHIHALLRQAQRPLIIAGPDPEGTEYNSALIAFAEKAGIPVFAEGISNVRHHGGNHSHVISIADLMLRSEAFRNFCVPDCIIRTGNAPTNKMMQDFIEGCRGIPQLHISPYVQRNDPEFVVTDRIIAHAKPLFESAIGHIPENGYFFDFGWIAQLLSASDEARTALSAALGEEHTLTEAVAYNELASLLPDGTAVMLSNSMPVRDWETWGQPAGSRLECYCNRGVNGIDGVTSTALGIARSRGEKTVLITGDLAFLHDLNGLWAARGNAINATIVLINNNGGEIFRMLPIRKFEPPFKEHFTVPHGLDLSKAGELFGIEYYRAKNAYQLQTFLNISLGAPGLQIIEIPTDQNQEPEIRKRITVAVTARVDAVLSVPSPDGTPPPVFALHITAHIHQPHTGNVPAMFLHGFTRSGASWKRVLGAMPDNRTLYLADLMGHGASPAPEFESAPDAYALEYQAARLHDFVLATGIEQMHLTGYSMGGRVALFYALEHPERVASLALISASPGIANETVRRARAESDAALAERMLRDGLEPFIDSWSSSAIIADGIDDVLAQESRRDRLSQRVAGLRGSLLGMGQGVQPSLWSRLSALSVSVLLLYGMLDAKYADIVAAMENEIPDAKILSVSGAGHDILSAQPEELATALMRFWEENGSRNR